MNARHIDDKLETWRTVETPQSRCCLGLARCDITPPVGIYHRMWGAATHERAAGIHRPLTADAICFQPLGHSSATEPDVAGESEQGDSEQILIAVDHCLLFNREMQVLLDAVSKRSQVKRETLLVVFSHTHSSGLMDSDRQHLPSGELIGPYLESLAER